MNARQEAINSHIQAAEYASISALSKLFPDVSPMTVRRDLEFLENAGQIVRVHGGAKSIKSLSRLTEEIFSLRALEMVNEKKEIAEKALAFVKDETSIYIDSGTTALCFAQALPSDKKLFITTSAPNIALGLIGYKNVTVNLIGGKLNADSITVSGAYSSIFIENLNFDAAFLATTGFTIDRGFTNGSLSESELKKLAIKRAVKKIVLFDSSKVGKIMPYTFARLSDIDYIISDGNFDEKLKNQIKKQGVEVV